MNLSNEDKQLLEKLCKENKVNFDKVLKLLSKTIEYEIKNRRIGIYDDLKKIITSKEYD